MMDAPDRIWADWWETEDTMPATISCNTPKSRQAAQSHRVDYIRADLVQRMVGEAVERQREIGRQIEANVQAAREAEFNRAQMAKMLPEFIALLSEAANDLATYVDADWPREIREKYPDCQRKWHRDMDLVYRIAAAIRKGGG